MNNRIEYRNKKHKILMYLFGSLIFVIAGLSILFIKRDFNENPLEIIFAYSSIILFGFGVVVFSKYLLSNKPVLILDDSGLFDNSSWLSVGRIEWKQIKHFVIYEEVLSKWNRIKFISIDLSDNEAFLKKMNPVKKALHKTGKMFAPYSINISTKLMDVDATQLLELMKKYYNQALDSQSEYDL